MRTSVLWLILYFTLGLSWYIFRFPTPGLNSYISRLYSGSQDSISILIFSCSGTGTQLVCSEANDVAFGLEDVLLDGTRRKTKHLVLLASILPSTITILLN